MSSDLNMESFDAALERTLLAGTRVLWVRTTEETRLIEHVEHGAERLQWPVRLWSPTSGIDHDGHPRTLFEVLTDLHGQVEAALWVLLDGGSWLRDPKAVRLLRELAQSKGGPVVVLVDPPNAPEATNVAHRVPEVVCLALPPPDVAELQDRVETVERDLRTERSSRGPRSLLGEEAAELLAAAGLGLDAVTFDRLIAEGIAAHGFDATAVARFIASHKPALLDSAGLLSVIEPVPAEQLGGLEHLKAWLLRRAVALQPEARQAGIATPRGVLLLGVQGCGKSLAARVCAHMLNLKLVRLEPGRLFGGTVGESEANLRYVTHVTEQMAPIVLWIDELDKGFAGSGGERSDAGTSARVLGAFLTWLQERRRPVFVVATANRVDTVPAELLRRGRLDEIFFVDLPDARAREAILRVHLEVIPRERTASPPPLASPWSAFAEVMSAAEGYSGAEIESAVTDARLAAFVNRNDLHAEDIRLALSESIPLSVTRAEEVRGLRDWARTRARPA